MIQQINLYQDEFRRATPALGAVRAAQILAVFVALLTAASLVLVWQANRQQERLVAARQALAAQQRVLAELRAAPLPQEDPRLRQAVAQLEREAAARRAFLADFAGDRLGNSDGFSSYLSALARRPLPELWLRRIELAGDGSLAFEGTALRPGAVPAFVRALTAEPVFKGREFRTLRMVEDGGRVEFDLRSRERSR